MKRRHFLTTASAAGLAAAAAGTPAATAEHHWKMVTSWPKGFPGPGTGAERLARRIEAASGGRLTVRVYGAGELVPALQVFDAVAAGQAEMGHSASFFWRGKIPASVFFTTVPFGLTPGEHVAWIVHGGGQALWDTLYAPFRVKPFMAGNSGMQMGGWFKREIHGLDDLKGLKYRIPGLGGAMLERLGVQPIVIPPPEIFTALQTGAVDGAEFLGPWSDLAAGFYRVAPYYYWPGFHEPNGTAEALVSQAALDALPADLRAVVEQACAAENGEALAETEWRNAEALQTLVTRHGVKLRQFPAPVLAAAREAAAEVLAALGESDAGAREVLASYRQALERARAWAAVSTGAFLGARGG
ncbi:MAG: TRAP transporter substrate-binding protein [Ectothiorhodospiraceae bacterium]|nr:TRAP transporter substrate-binding protein [Chromatiales bacterium]MCP5156462.1 TRAP transporter substrate-binding protein [Ectothiorhodospiraceae bacterium]